MISTLPFLQLGATTMGRRVSADQLDCVLVKCRWFSILCDEVVDSSSMVQLMLFIRMVFHDFAVTDLALLPTTRGVDI